MKSPGSPSRNKQYDAHMKSPSKSQYLVDKEQKERQRLDNMIKEAKKRIEDKMNKQSCSKNTNISSSSSG